MDMCEWWQHEIGREMDAGFDCGEFSSQYHDEAQENLTPCGTCDYCIAAKNYVSDHPDDVMRREED